jgi:hypothetical protein
MDEQGRMTAPELEFKCPRGHHHADDVLIDLWDSARVTMVD